MGVQSTKSRFGFCKVFRRLPCFSAILMMYILGNAPL